MHEGNQRQFFKYFLFAKLALVYYLKLILNQPVTYLVRDIH